MVIPPAILSAGALRFGVNGDEIRYLGGGGPGAGGVVYRCHRDESEWTLKYMPGGEDVARIYNEKLCFVYYLAEQVASVPRPQLSLNGHFSEVVTCGQDLFIVSSENVAPGRHVNTRNPAEWNEAFFFNWGKLIGQIHACTAKYPLWHKADSSTPVESPTLIPDWADEWRSFDEWCQEDAVRERWRELRCQLDKLPVERDSFGLIQNDPHPWNILAEGSRLTLIDFDVANYTWFMMDLGIAAYAALCLVKPEAAVAYDQYAVIFLHSFLNGYRSDYRLDAYWLQTLPLFLGYRRILLSIVMYDETKKHPSRLQRWRDEILNDAPVIPQRMTLEWPE